MAPKGKAKKTEPTPPQPAQPEPKTIGEKFYYEYKASRPYQFLHDTKGWEKLTPDEKSGYANFRILESESYVSWSAQEQKEFFALCEKQKIPIPLPEPPDFGKDRKGREIRNYSLEEFAAFEAEREELLLLKAETRRFRAQVQRSKLREEVVRESEEEIEDAALREKQAKRNERYRPVTSEEIEEEKKRRVRIAQMEGRNQVGVYEGEPEWDDVVPIPQQDGENPLAAIAYTDEYAEAISYLRAAMAANEHTPRILDLTEHVISMNAAHYTVWLYRAATLFALNSSLMDELTWLNGVARKHQKNYQIWHHRQVLIDKLYPNLESREDVDNLARSEIKFAGIMLQADSKNYHVWSYRQYLIRKLGMFPSQTDGKAGLSELKSTELLIAEDVRNNSAWSHRFFVAFSDPAISTEGSKATEHDPKIPDDVIDREIRVAENAIWRAPQNPSPWNYLRGVLRKGGRDLKTLEGFAGEFVKLGEAAQEEDIKSSHALDFLADVWAEKGELEKADMALKLLGDKYDAIRKNYWDWRRESLPKAS